MTRSSRRASLVLFHSRPIAVRKPRMRALLIGVLMLAGCATQPARAPQPITDESLTVAAETPATPVAPTAIVAATEADRPTTTSPDLKPPAPAATINEDNNVFFERGSTSVSANEKDKLKEHARRLKQNPKMRVTLTGYADDLGSSNYRLAVAEERLVVVSKLLREFGVSQRQIRRNRSAGLKSTTACSTRDCQRLRRRVELVYPK